MAARLAESEVFFHRPPTKEEALAMAEEERQYMQEKYGWTADLRHGWRILQRTVGDLKSALPRGRELLRIGLSKFL